MFAKRLQHRLETAVATLVFAGLSLLPLERASAAGGWILPRIARLTRRDARTKRQIAAVMPDLDEESVRRIAAKSWEVLGRTIAELPRLEEIFGNPNRIRIINGHVLESALESDRGTVYAAAHLGNWELLPGVAALSGQRFFGFYRPLSNSVLDDRLLAIRSSTAGDGALLPAASRSVGKMVSALRRGDSVGILADLFEGKGIESHFLGLPTRTNSLAATLALRCDARIVIVTIRRLPDVRFELRFEEIEAVSTGDRAADIEATTALINRKIEAAILADPGQWLWSTNRWKGLKLDQQDR